MRVLHVIPSVSERSGGPAQAIVSMCRALMDQGVEVVLATTDHDLSVSKLETRNSKLETDVSKLETRNRRFETRNSYKGIPTVCFPMQRGESFKYSRPLAVWLDANVKSFDVVHIHAVFNHACIAAARACRKHGVPYVVRPLGTLDPWSMKQKPLRKLLFWQVAGKRMLQNAAAVHYTAPDEKLRTEESLGLNHGRVIPLGLDTTLDQPVNGHNTIAQKLPGVADHPYVLVLSRLHPKKAIDVLIDAFVALREDEKFQEWKLVLAGEGPDDYVRALREKVTAHHADDSVIFAGWLEGEDKRVCLQRASLLALTSYQENFGVCAMEALSAGVPVLVSPHVNLAKEIESANAGWITAVDKTAITAALAEALSSKAERVKRGESGRMLSGGFSNELAASRLIEMYQSISAVN